MIQVGGYEPCTVTDFEVPKRFGLRQTIADTLGIGGIMRGLRTIPVVLDMCADMEEVCPDVWFLNYTNPMAINCRAISRASSIRTVGLCHSVQGTAFELSQDLGIPYREIDYLAAGINHMAFYLRFERDGEDLYPRLRELAESGSFPDGNRVRYEVLQHFGYFVTESSEHFAEYVPWFIKRDRPDLIEQFNVPLDEYPPLRRPDRGLGSRTRATRTRRRDRSAAQLRVRIHDHPQHRDRQAARDLRQRRQPRPHRRPAAGCTVEVPCLVDGNGVQPTHIGALPPQLTALIRTNVNVQELTVEAALTGRREHVYHAAMLDPHTAAELDLDQIHALVDELIDAHGAWIPRSPERSPSMPEANEAERRRWNDERWVAVWPKREALTDTITPYLLDALALQPGERVLDVGCGGGKATIAAAQAVGPTGNAIGADISDRSRSSPPIEPPKPT